MRILFLHLYSDFFALSIDSEKIMESRREWGGGIMGRKSTARTAKKLKAIANAIKV
jgi:hypothetical protein